MGKIKGANKKLLDSARIGDVQGVEKALAAGAGSDAKDKDGWTAAMLAAINVQGGCLGLLIAAGADLEAKSRHGLRAIMAAASHGRQGCVGLLIQAGADLEAKGNDGATAAMQAESNGRLEIAALIGRVLLCRSEMAQLDPRGGRSAPPARVHADLTRPGWPTAKRWKLILVRME